MVIRFQLQRVGECGLCGNTDVPLYFQPEPALRADRGKVWCIWCWKRHYGIGVYISAAEGGPPHAAQVAFSIHDDDWATVQRAVEHPLYPAPLELDEPSDPSNPTLAERSVRAAEALCAAATNYVTQQRRQKWDELLAGTAVVQYDLARYCEGHEPPLLAGGTAGGGALLNGGVGASGGILRDMRTGEPLPIEELERRLALLRSVQSTSATAQPRGAASGAHTEVLRSWSSSNCLRCGAPLPDDKLYRCDACDNTLRDQRQQAGLLPTALSLILRMARGYDWRSDEVDAFEAACRVAGITIDAGESSSDDE